MHPAAARGHRAAGQQHVGEQVGAPGLVVDVAHHGVLDRDPAPSRLGVAPGGVDHLVDLPARVDRHELVAQLVVGGVQAERERDRQPLLGQLAHPRHQAHGAHRDAARGHAVAIGALVGQPAAGADDGLVVGHRLAHAHEHDVVDPPRSPGHLAARERTGPGDDLLHDLAGAHVALQAALAGGAEGARHAAAGLAGDAHGGAVLVAHQHRLDERPVEEPPQRLAGGAAVGLGDLQRGHQARQQALGQLLALRGRQVGHLRRVVGQAREVVRRDLAGAVAGEAQLLQPRLALGGCEVSEVARRLAAAARLLEDEGKGLHWLHFTGWVSLTTRPVSHPDGPCSESTAASSAPTPPRRPRAR